MNAKRLAGLCLCLVVVACLAASFAAPQEKRAEGPSAPDPAEEMRQWMALSTPGKAHRLLDPLAGTWEAEGKAWMAGPDAPPVRSTGTMVNRWVLDGRFMLQEYEGKMPVPGADPMPFKGMGLIGHDNFRNVYVSMWTDSVSTTFLTMNGSADPSGKVFDFYGTMDEPAIKVIGRTVRTVLRIVDADHHVLEFHDLHGGARKVMEMTYTRKR